MLPKVGPNDHGMTPLLLEITAAVITVSRKIAIKLLNGGFIECQSNNHIDRLVLLTSWKGFTTAGKNRLRVGRYGVKSFICIFWNPFGVLHERPLEESPTKIHHVYHHKLNQVADKHRSHNERNTIPARQSSWANDKSNKNSFFSRNAYVFRLSPYSPDIATNDLQLFRSLQHLLTEKLFNVIEEVETCIHHCFA